MKKNEKIKNGGILLKELESAYNNTKVCPEGYIDLYTVVSLYEKYNNTYKNLEYLHKALIMNALGITEEDNELKKMFFENTQNLLEFLIQNFDMLYTYADKVYGKKNISKKTELIKVVNKATDELTEIETKLSNMEVFFKIPEFSYYVELNRNSITLEPTIQFDDVNGDYTIVKYFNDKYDYVCPSHALDVLHVTTDGFLKKVYIPLDKFPKFLIEELKLEKTGIETKKLEKKLKRMS